MRKPTALLLLALSAGVPSALAQSAGEGGRRLEASAYVQSQYERIDTAADGRDRTFFRRMVVTLEGQPNARWQGTVQVDLAPVTAGHRLVVKDAHLQYLGWQQHGLTLTVGNQKPPFSRSLLTSSSRRHAIERPFTGDRSLGSPGRAIGVRLDGWTRGRTIRWDTEIASSFQSPDARQVRIDGLPEAEAEWNEGVLLAGRLEWHPRGEVARQQGAFIEGLTYVVAVAAYSWHNDDDRNLHTADGRSTSGAFVDVARVGAFEVSAALRAGRLAIDSEFERVLARALDPAFAGGLYERGRASIAKASVEAGYMVVPRQLEIVGVLDAARAATYARPWRRAAAGASWYLDAHNVKVQLLHRISRYDRGSEGIRGTATYLQAHISF